MYAAWGTTPGFGLHCDDHDVFIIQIIGEKRWALYGESQMYPGHRKEDNLASLKEPKENYTLRPGDVLYLPRGHWHNVVGIGEPTIHLTVGVTNHTGVDILAHIADKLRKSDSFQFQSDIPQFSTLEEKHRYAENFKNALIAQINSDLVDAYLDASRVRFRANARSHPSFPNLSM